MHRWLKNLVPIISLALMLLVDGFFVLSAGETHKSSMNNAGNGLSPCVPVMYRLTPEQLSISLWAQKQVRQRAGFRAPRQNSKDLCVLYKEAGIADGDLKRITRDIAENTGGTPVFPPGGRLKGRQRAEEKVEVELGGDASKLFDIARSSIEYQTVEAVYKALEFIIANGYPVVRIKDRALYPLPSGFWDIHLNLQMPNGHVVELQLHLAGIRRYSMGHGHELYTLQRSVKARAYREHRPLTSEERKVLDRLNCEQRRFYQEAFSKGQVCKKE